MVMFRVLYVAWHTEHNHVEIAWAFMTPLLRQQFFELFFYCLCSGIKCRLFWRVIGGCRSLHCRDKARRAIQVIEAMLDNPGVDMTPVARQVRLFGHNDDPISLTHCS